jgi:hypothetical protein
MARKLREERLESKARRDRGLDAVRAADTRTLDDRERLDEFRQSLYQSVLPNLPKIKGYHVIWLTTTNPADSIAARMRLGYEPIKPSEVPGYETLSLKTGEYAGCIGVNEMVAFKLPLRLFQLYMEEAHHTQPLLEEQKLEDAVEAVREQAMMTASSRRARKSIKVEREEGTEDIISDRPAPKFRKLFKER